VSNNLNYNQVSFDALTKYGRDLLTNNINDPAVVAAGIKKPYPSFNGIAAVVVQIK
jgi:hypothetical protein